MKRAEFCLKLALVPFNSLYPFKLSVQNTQNKKFKDRQIKFQGRTPKFKDFSRANSFLRSFQGNPKIQRVFNDCVNTAIWRRTILQLALRHTTLIFQWKLIICTYKPHCPSFRNSNIPLQKSSLFFKCLYADTYLFHGPLSKVVILLQINAPLWYKMTWSESESKHCVCQWTLVSFLFKHDQFSRESRLTWPLWRKKEEAICIDIIVER